MNLNSQLKTPALLRNQCFIAGQWFNAMGGNTLDVINPATQAVVTTIPCCGGEDAQVAINAAQKAQQQWQCRTAKERAQVLRKWYEQVIAHQEDLALIMTIEQGKPLAEAQGEVQYAASFIEWFAEEAKRAYGDVIPSTVANRHILTLKQAVGVCAAITPWNFPLAMITRKAAPALAAGCAMVVKPAEQTPLSALALAYLAEQAGLPKGLLSVLCGDAISIGQVLTSSPVVRKLSFTGSTQVGKLLMQQCGATVKKISLELGGNAPFIVFDDADLEAAVAGAMAAKYRNSGQTCVCTNRFLVHDSVYDAFAEKLAVASAKLKVGQWFAARGNARPVGRPKRGTKGRRACK